MNLPSLTWMILSSRYTTAMPAKIVTKLIFAAGTARGPCEGGCGGKAEGVWASVAACCTNHLVLWCDLQLSCEL